MELNDQLKRFQSRVKVVRAWRGFAIGGTLGGALSVVLAVLDWRRLVDVGWVGLAAPVLIGALAGILLGLLSKIGVRELALSLDRRANLKDRLSTAQESHRELFGDPQREDAFAHLHDAHPREVYPARFTSWHAGPVVTFLLAAAIYLFAGSSILLTPDQKKEREEVKQEGAKIERVVAPVVQKPVTEVGQEEKDLANELAKRAREMQRGRVGKQEALQANEEAQRKLQELTEKRFEAAEENMMQAQSVAEKLAVEEARKRNEISAEQAKEMTAMLQKQRESGEDSRNQPGRRMTEIERQLNAGRDEQGKPMSAEQRAQLEAEKRALTEAAKDMQNRMEEIRKQLESGKDEQGDPLSPEERKQLEQQMKQLQDLMKEFQLSQKVQEMMQKMQQMKELKELQDALQKLRENQQATEQGKPPTLTPEQLEQLKEQLKQLQQQLEEMAKSMSDEQMKEMLKQMAEAAKNGKMGAGGMGMGMGLGLGLGMGMPGSGMGMPSNGASGPGKDNFFRNTGKVPLEDPKNAKGKGIATSVTGRRQISGDESYLEVRGPTGLGQRSKTPYYKVLPKYQKQAEEALEKEAIPQQHRKRVKEYFEALQSGGK